MPVCAGRLFKSLFDALSHFVETSLKLLPNRLLLALVHKVHFGAGAKGRLQAVFQISLSRRPKGKGREGGIFLCEVMGVAEKRACAERRRGEENDITRPLRQPSLLLRTRQ